MKDQFSQECIVGVRVRTEQRGFPDNRRAGDTVNLFAAVPAVDHRPKSLMRLGGTYEPRALDTQLPALLVDTNKLGIAQHDLRIVLQRRRDISR